MSPAPVWGRVRVGGRAMRKTLTPVALLSGGHVGLPPSRLTRLLRIASDFAPDLRDEAYG